MWFVIEGVDGRGFVFLVCDGGFYFVYFGEKKQSRVILL